MREVLSLQFGHYANFIGTHWWNIQETGFNYAENAVSEINHDVLFREGTTNRGDITFTPRLLLADLKGSLRTLPEQGDLYEPITNPATSTIIWPDNQVEVIEENKITKNSFQQAIEHPKNDIIKLNSKQLDEDVNVWSDFLYSRYHPRSVNIIQEYQHEDTDKCFDVYPLGTSLWQSSQYSDNFCDKIRNYIEECDSLQGFHVTVDVINAFGALASSCIEHIKDEYDKKSILTFSVIPSHYYDYNFTTAEEREKSTKHDSIRLTNLALSLASLTEYSSLVVPLCTGSKGWRQPGPKRSFNHVSYNHELLYHTSAIIASLLETISLIYRTKKTQFTINDFCADLNGHGRKIAAASLCLPFNIKSGVDLIDCLDNWDGPLWQNLTPNCHIGTDKLLQIVSARGISESRLKRPAFDEKAKKQREMPAYRCDSVQEMLTFYLSCTSYATANHVSSIETAMSTKTPYPDIFDNFVGKNGDIIDTHRPNNESVHNVPVIAGCHSGSPIGDMIETLHRDANRIKITRFHQFLAAGLENDDYKESLDKLQDLKECYE